MTNELTYRVLTPVLFLVMVVIRDRTRKRSDQRGQLAAYHQNQRDTVLMFTIGTLNTISILVYAMLPNWIDWAHVDLPDWLRWTGVVFGVFSISLLGWSDRHLGLNYSPTLRIREEHRLIETGPYQWIRHPIYASGVLFMLGIFLVSSNAVVGFCWSGLLLLYAQRIPREEAMMLNQFGDGYRRYMNRTGRWIPRLRLDRDITER